MIPVSCQVKHDPENGQYGDCLRACVATILELPSNDVPHFFYDGCDGQTGHQRMRDFLRTKKLLPFVTAWSGMSVDAVKKGMNDLNKDVIYILLGATKDGGHAVVCKNDQVVHNPHWAGTPITKPGEDGLISAIVLVNTSNDT